MTVKTVKTKYQYQSKKSKPLTREVLILNAELAISKHLSTLTLLSGKIDDWEQYSLQPCLVFQGLNNVD